MCAPRSRIQSLHVSRVSRSVCRNMEPFIQRRLLESSESERLIQRKLLRSTDSERVMKYKPGLATI